jgi:hypothetical protein
MKGGICSTIAGEGKVKLDCQWSVVSGLDDAFAWS